MSGTVYDVKVKYTTEDKASTGLKNIGSAADKAQRSGMGLQNVLLGIGAAAGTFMAGKKLLIDYNSEIETMRIGISTVLRMQLHIPFKKAREEADGLFDRLQEIAKKSPATTKDFITMANIIAPAVGQVGGNIKNIERLSEGAVLAGQAFGIQADVAGRDVRQMLAGNVTDRDIMAQMLLGSRGISAESFNKMEAKDRLSTTESVLQDPALKKAGEEFGASFQGQMSTLQDTLQIALGKVGLPLVQEISKEISRWNTWIEKNPQIIAEWSAKFSKGLVTGFKLVKEVASAALPLLKDAFSFLQAAAAFFVDNRDMILGLIQGLMVMKTVGAVGSVAGGIGRGLKGFADNLSLINTTSRNMASGLESTSDGFTAIKGALFGANGVIAGLGLLAVAAFGIYKWWQGKEDRERKAAVDSAGKTSKDMLVARAQYFGLDSKINTRRDILADEGLGLGHEKYQRISREIEELEAQKRAMGLEVLNNAGLRSVVPGKGESYSLHAANMKTSLGIGAMARGGEGGGADVGLYTTQAAAASLELYQKILGDMGASHVGKSGWQQVFVPFADGVDPNADQVSGVVTPPQPAKVEVKINKIEVASEDPDRFVFGMVKAAEEVMRNPTQSTFTIPGGS